MKQQNSALKGFKQLCEYQHLFSLKIYQVVKVLIYIQNQCLLDICGSLIKTVVFLHWWLMCRSISFNKVKGWLKIRVGQKYLVH
jgi:hypothetical protein